MPFNFDASEDITNSFSQLLTLIEYSNREKELGNEENRRLFLKLSVVLIVTKFQVFIENILEEYVYKLTLLSKKSGEIPLNLRLNSLHLLINSNNLNKILENFEKYNVEKLNEMRVIVNSLTHHCVDDDEIINSFHFNTIFPLGKTGLNELIKLFRQINGEDIFENAPFDRNKLNEILGKRHSIIHEDSNPQLTEEIIQQYHSYIGLVITYLDNYLGTYL